jgi:DNA-binding transcriptional LysR family regulator
MTLRQLEYLLAVVECASFTRAAQRLLISQPALSHQIRALEASVGGELLERGSRAVAPTALGRELLPHARATVDAAREAAEAARAVGALQAGELRVAALYSVAMGVVPPAIRAWRKLHPEVRVELSEYPNRDRLAEAMGEGAADLAVGPVPDGWSGPSRILGAEQFVVVLPEGDPLLDGDPEAAVAIRALAGRRWVHYAAESGMRPLVTAVCEAAGFTPRAAVRVSHTSTAVELAAAGLGPALVPRNVVGPDFAPFTRPADPPVEREQGVYARAALSPPAAAFIDVLAEHARL